jgi:ferrous iron transport protein B
VKHFIYRAGTLIFAVSVVLWAMLNLPPGVSNPKDSFAGYVGRALVPIFKPMGLEDWQITTSLIPAFLAREIVLSSMAVIYSVEEGKKEEFEPKKALQEQGVAFVNALKESVLNLLSPMPKALEVKEEHSQLKSAIKNSMNPAQALAFMVFYTLIHLLLRHGRQFCKRREAQSLLCCSLAYSFAVAWVSGVIAYRLMSLLVG